MQDKKRGAVAKDRLNEQIDENLRRVYQQALDEKVPDRFAELLNALRRKDSGQ